MTLPEPHATSTQDLRSGRSDWLSVLPITLLALLVRLQTLDDLSLWIDELHQVLMYYSGGFKEVMYRAAGQGQPPLDYWIGHVVFKFDQSDFAARLPAAIFGTLTVPTAFFLARKIVERPMALLVAVGLACSPYAIHYSQEARPYALFWFSLVLSILLLVRAWQSNRWRDWGLVVPALFCCQFARSLEPLMMMTGLGLIALFDLFKELRHGGCAFLRPLLTYRGTRLSMCLLLVWPPFLHILAYIMHRMSRWNYLGEQSRTVDWEVKRAMLGMACEALAECAMPLAVLLVPLGIVGVWMGLRRHPHARTGVTRLIFLPIVLGYIIHVAVYTMMIRNELPKYAYWGYMLPFLYLGAALLLQRLVDWWKSHHHSSRVLRLAWMATACGLALQLACDHGRAVVNKEDWRGAMGVVAEHMGPEEDVVFVSEAAEFGSAGMVFRVSPHYLPTDRHLINLLRDPEKMFNEGRPVLDRRDCRVALVMNCPPDWTPDVLRARMSSHDITRFALHPLNQFFVLVSRDRYLTADAGLIALGEVANSLLGADRSLGVYFNMGLAWVVAKQGDTDRAAHICQSSRGLVRPEFREGFDLIYKHLSDLIGTAEARAVRLISHP